MDPNATLENIIEAIMCDDQRAVWEHTADLMVWLSRGGFEPIKYDRPCGLTNRQLLAVLTMRKAG